MQDILLKEVINDDRFRNNCDFPYRKVINDYLFVEKIHQS